MEFQQTKSSYLPNMNKLVADAQDDRHDTVLDLIDRGANPENKISINKCSAKIKKMFLSTVVGNVQSKLTNNTRKPS